MKMKTITIYIGGELRRDDERGSIYVSPGPGAAMTAWPEGTSARPSLPRPSSPRGQRRAGAVSHASLVVISPAVREDEPSA